MEQSCSICVSTDWNIVTTINDETTFLDESNCSFQSKRKTRVELIFTSSEKLHFLKTHTSLNCMRHDYM